VPSLRAVPGDDFAFPAPGIERRLDEGAHLRYAAFNVLSASLPMSNANHCAKASSSRGFGVQDGGGGRIDVTSSMEGHSIVACE
jgi:hypothetical protein